MKIACVADVHLGNHRRFGGAVECSMNERCRLATGVFSRAISRAIAIKVDLFVVLGDLFDTDRPPPQIIATVHDALREAQEAGVRVIVEVGNHDQTSAARGDHALDVLAPYAEVIDSPSVVRLDGVDLLCVPFAPEAGEDWLRKVLPSMVAELGGEAGGGAQRVPSRLLALHMGIRDDKTPKWLSGARDAIDVGALGALCAEFGIGTVLAGNWHDRRRWELFSFPKGGGLGAPCEVFQLGALVPTGFDNPGLVGYGTLGLWEDGELDYEELSGPRFVKTDDADLSEVLAPNEELGHKLFVSWTVGADDLVSATGVIDSLRASGKIVNGEALADKVELDAAARSAAYAARSATTLDSAVDAFVGRMHLEEGTDRAAVLESARAYLSKAVTS